MARGDWIDAGSSSLSSRSGAKQGFYYRYSNTLEDAITDNKDIIQVIPYGFRTGTGTTAYAYTTLTSSFTYKIGSNTAVSTSIGTQYDYSDATTVNKIYYFTSSTPFKRMSGATLLSSVNGKTGYGFAFENPHNEDGTSNAVIMTWFFNGSDSHGDATKSITITPDAIPRGSTLGEIADFELDSSFAINITKHVSSYTDDLVIKVEGTTIKTYSGISNGDTISFTSAEQTTIKGLVTTPQIPIVFELSSYNGSVQVGTTSTQTAIASTLDVPILDSWNKTSTGYQYAINGLVDTTLDDGLQIANANGNGMVYGEKVLYDVDDGSNATITLNETIENFKYIEIFYMDNNDEDYTSSKIYLPNDKSITLGIFEAGSSSNTYIRRTRYTLSGTTITPNNTTAGFVRISSGTVTTTVGTNYIKIVRVIGIR